MKDLIQKLKNHGYNQSELFEENTISANDISFMKLRDKLYSLGHIIEEDCEHKIYIAELKTSKFSKSTIVAIKLRSNKLYMCGISTSGKNSKSTTIKAFSLIHNIVNEKNTEKNSKKPLFICIVSGVVLAIAIFIVVDAFCIMKATEEYNSEVKKFNNTVSEYNELTEKGEFLTIEDMPEKMEELKTQKTNFLSALGVVFSANNASKINNDSKTIVDMTKENENAIMICKQVIAPSQEFVINKLNSIDSIKEVEAVTKENDANGLLGKEKGYYSCAYFSTNLLDNSDLAGNSLIEKGTDGGGCIELFNDLESAKERCKYLSSFDGTILTSGSYVLVGTIVIRTSYKLDSTEQYKLTNSIVKAFTTI